MALESGVEVEWRIGPIVPWVPNNMAAANRTNSIAAVITNPSELARSSSSRCSAGDTLRRPSAPAAFGLPSRCSGFPVKSSLARSLPTFSPKWSRKVVAHTVAQAVAQALTGSHTRIKQQEVLRSP